MGISGLLPLLRSIHKQCTLKKFAGQTIGIDAYGWLHRGTVACAIELALDKPTTKYVDFAMSRVRMLLDFGITPYLVFDGDNLPSKAQTNKERRKKRNESKALGLELYKAGKLSQAHQELQKSADVTPYMARLLIEELKKYNVQYVVAPYEADAQLAYLERKGIIDGILSEDSDLLVFGAKRLITKLNQYGECIEIERANFPRCKDVSLADFNDTMFRRMAILSGCDYLTNIEKMGLKTAHRYVRKYQEVEKILRMVQFEGKLIVPTEYLENFRNAELTFLHHRVFCPIEQKMVFLSPLNHGMDDADMPFLGTYVEAETAIGVACGDLDPKSKQPIVIRSTALKSRPMNHNRRQTLPPPSLKPKSSIESFLKANREPLAELDPNSLTPSPSQQRLLQRNRNASWEPRLVSSAPQLRRSVTAGQTQSSSISTSSEQRAFLARASAVSTYQPPKRPRLCAETEDLSPSKTVKQSPFFSTIITNPSPLAQKKSKSKKARKSDFDIWSDDSINDVLLGLSESQEVSTTSNSFESCVSGEVTSIPQSSPVISSPLPPQGKDVQQEVKDHGSQPIGSQNQELEQFNDLLEYHVQKQSELRHTFSYQSPEKRDAALKSMTSKSSQSAVHKATFVAQSPEVQKTALKSLKPAVQISQFSFNQLQTSHEHSSSDESKSKQSALEKVKLGQAAMGRLSKDSVEPHTSSVSASDKINPNQSSHKISVNRASEVTETFPSKIQKDQLQEHTRPATPIVVGSEDAIIPNSDDENSEFGSPEQKPKINLQKFVFTPT